MEYNSFGPTGKKIFRIGLGTYGHGEAYGGISKNESLMVLHTAPEYATKEASFLIDTAPRYGNGVVETWIGEFLKGSKKNNILIATKGGRHIEPGRVNEKDFNPEFLKSDLEQSLTRLGVDSVFLYQLHNPSLNEIKNGSALDVLEEMRQQGKIQWYGVSIDTAEEGIAAIEVCQKRGYKGLASLQLIYNVLQKDVLEKLGKRAQESGVAIVAREPLLRGFLTDLYKTPADLQNLPPAPKKIIEWYGEQQVLSKISSVKEILKQSRYPNALANLSLAFVLAHPEVTIVIPGINRQEYLQPDLEADGQPLNQSLLEKLQLAEDIRKVAKTKNL